MIVGLFVTVKISAVPRKFKKNILIIETQSNETHIPPVRVDQIAHSGPE